MKNWLICLLKLSDNSTSQFCIYWFTKATYWTFVVLCFVIPLILGIQIVVFRDILFFFKFINYLITIESILYSLPTCCCVELAYKLYNRLVQVPMLASPIPTNSLLLPRSQYFVTLLNDLAITAILMYVKVFLRAEVLLFFFLHDVIIEPSL